MMINNIWRLWCHSLGTKSGKNDKEANIIALIRTIIFASYLITNCFIIAGVIYNFNKPSCICEADINKILR